MTDTRIDGLVALIENRYGPYSEDEREAVGGFLAWRVDTSPEILGRAFDAIRQAHEIRFGPPDEGKVRTSIIEYEKEYNFSLRPRGTMRSVPEPEPVSEAEAEQLREIAEQAGIDTSKEGWMARYFFRRCGELARGKRFA